MNSTEKTVTIWANLIIANTWFANGSVFGVVFIVFALLLIIKGSDDAP
jgi:hypothetical protein